MQTEKNEKVIKLFKMFGEDFLGSRWAGEQVREIMEEAIMRNNQTVVLDFEGITGITQSFGDEVVGIFARAFGKEFVKKNIKAVNISEDVKLIMNWSVKVSVKYGQKTSSPSPSSSDISRSLISVNP